MHIKLDQRAYYKVRTTAPLACLYHSTSEAFAIGPGIRIVDARRIITQVR